MKAILSAIFMFSLASVPAFAESDSAEGDAAKGEKLFNKCKACHTVSDTSNKTGPNLVKVVGRKVASVEGYKYSADLVALGEAGTVWDEANLDKYLANPKDLAPKGKMSFPGLKKEEERADLIAYLKTK